MLEVMFVNGGRANLWKSTEVHQLSAPTREFINSPQNFPHSSSRKARRVDESLQPIADDGP